MSTELKRVVHRAREAFNSRKLASVEFRKDQLRQIFKLVDENEALFVSALQEDLGKSRFESVITETDFVKNDVLNQLFNLDDYVKKEPVNKTMVTSFDQLYLQPEPYGVVLAIGTWNYPVMVTLCPTIGAIAAGNAVIMKPSEVAPATAELLAKLIPKYISKDVIQVVLGGPEVIKELLEERFDYIFFTGSTAIGRHIHAAAARHLTPVTLEMGGKSPCYIDASVNESDLDTAVRRILWGKFINSGQTCVAPDYVICSAKVQAKFVEVAKNILKQFFGDNPMESPDFARIVNRRHHERLSGLLKATKGKIEIGGSIDEENIYIEPTVVSNVLNSDSLMSEEIFGPILPIVPTESLEEAIELINSREKPLSLYVFSARKQVIEELCSKTSSGSVCANDVVIHLSVDTLPFGGVGASGMGVYHGRHSFDTFSHKKSVLVRGFNPVLEWVASKRYPPYSENHLIRLMRIVRKRKLPLSVDKIPFGSIATFVAGIAAANYFKHFKF